MADAVPPRNNTRQNAAAARGTTFTRISWLRDADVGVRIAKPAPQKVMVE